MKYFALFVVAAMAYCTPARADMVLFDFNNGPLHAPLPLTLTVGGVTAQFSATGQGFSIQDTQQIILTLPNGFSGFGLVPNSVFSSDLIVTFPNVVVTDLSIMVAPQELNTDSTATMRLSAFDNGALVGTTTSMGSEPFFWPSSTLSFSLPSGFNSVVVHYDKPPPTGGDFGEIFVADNMLVTTKSAPPNVVPEPGSLGLLGIGVLGLVFCRRKICKYFKGDSDPIPPAIQPPEPAV